MKKLAVQTNLSEREAKAVSEVAKSEGISEAAVVRRAVMRDPDVQEKLEDVDGK